MADPLQQLIRATEAEVRSRHAETSYTDSYVAFLDILGMRKLINRPYWDLRRVFNSVEAAQQLYRQIRVPPGKTFLNRDHLNMTIISDAIALSIESDIDYAFSKLVGFSSYLIQKLLLSIEVPIFLRGGIVRGPVYHDGNTVFGPALVEAYELENELARNMRCIVSSSIESDRQVSEYVATPESALIRDTEDQMYFIHFARPEIVEFLRVTADEMLASDASEGVKSKYRWLRKYVSEWFDA